LPHFILEVGEIDKTGYEKLFQSGESVNFLDGHILFSYNFTANQLRRRGDAGQTRRIRG
jgi:hypothetical protein